MPLRPLVVQSLTQAKVVSAPATGTSVNVTGVERVSVQYNITAVSTPSAASLQLQRSNDGVLWTNQGAAVNVTATGSGVIELTVNTARFLRLNEAITSGSFTYTSSIVGLGY